MMERRIIRIGRLVLIVMEHRVRTQRDSGDYRVISWSVLVWLIIPGIFVLPHRTLYSQ
jgi:hypothetical protein